MTRSCILNGFWAGVKASVFNMTVDLPTTYDQYVVGKSTVILKTVGQTGCGKTTFVQNLAKNKMFGEIKMTDWVSKIKLSEKREDNIRKFFLTAQNLKFFGKK